LTAFAKAAGTRSDALPFDDLPVEVQHLWGWFCDLSGARSGNGYGGNPISHIEIEAWSRLSGIRLTPWEVAVLRRADSAFLAATYEKSAATSRAASEPKQIRADDAASVTALFAGLKARSEK